ncbi:parafibromin [Drosophila teissieri]|uniref:parafibromin n=1 Tax=Drosophila teissieri TaxID=7243 RepID=UPI001CBA4EED|nr:parafibromin [Drosophila teissieri]
MDPILKTLSQTMTVEAIAIIKAKRLAMKQSVDVAGRQRRALQRETDRQVNDVQADLCRRAMQRERPYRVFEEQLLGEKEMTAAQEYLHLVYDSKSRCMHSTPKESTPVVARKAAVVPTQLETRSEPPRERSKYNRYGQERFLKEQQEFGINPQGSHLERATTLRASPNRRQLKRTRSLSARSHQSAKGAISGRRPSNPHSRMPIIVVPAALTSLVTLYNAKQLLQEMRYVPLKQARRLMPHGHHLEEVIIEHRFQGELVSYRVIDNVTRLNPGEWERVAAVFAMGPHWQFKGWPQGADPAAIFHQVCAFHLHFKDTPVCKELCNLQLHPLALSPNERHSDCGLMMEFWNHLDHHMAVRARQFAFISQK